MILILTSPEDEPAAAVEWRLRRRGADVLRFDTADFPAAASVTVAYRDGVPRYKLRTREGVRRFDVPQAVWFRRPGPPVAHPHIADEEVRDVVERDCRELLDAVWDSFQCRMLPGTPSAMIVAQRKPWHMHRARALGFDTVPTLFTNDPDEFIDLYREQEGRLISKITASLSLRQRLGTDFFRYTTRVTTRDLAHAQSVALAPIVLQAYVPKLKELRVTVVGACVFAAEIDSQGTHHTSDDWRRYDLAKTAHRPHPLPDGIASRCVRLVADAGLTYGTIDLILTPDGRYVFLELNSAGEYFWIEQLTGLPISDAIADFLVGEPSVAAVQRTVSENDVCNV
jgi:hypothetical protein